MDHRQNSIVTATLAGHQQKTLWIPACAGMTKWSVCDNHQKFLYLGSGKQYRKSFFYLVSGNAKLQ
jgi:hypothetical protein